MGLILGVFVFQAEIALRDSIGSKQWTMHRQIAFGYGEPVCPNGVVEAGEECDDDNTDNTDYCVGSCQDAECGDTYVCSDALTCITGPTGGVEACDDGNVSNLDACLTTCAQAACGDGYVETGVEDCDDGNEIPADGCEPVTCTVTDGYSCTGTAPSVCTQNSSSSVASSSVAPDSSSVAPDSSSAEPDSSSAAPDSSSAAPDSSSVAPDSSSAEPDSSSAIPDSSSVAPDSSSAEPDSSSVAPDSSSAAPDSSSVVPDSSSPSSVLAPSSSEATGGGGIAGGHTFTPYPKIPVQDITVGCGNGIVEPDGGEECDIGRMNGVSPSCSIACKSAFCGDGIVQPETEECEPDRGGDGSYVLPPCGGKLCLPPTCDASQCYGGCRWVFSPKCAAGRKTSMSPIPSADFRASLLGGSNQLPGEDVPVVGNESWLMRLLESVLNAIDSFFRVMTGR